MYIYEGKEEEEGEKQEEMKETRKWLKMQG